MTWSAEKLSLARHLAKALGWHDRNVMEDHGQLAVCCVAGFGPSKLYVGVAEYGYRWCLLDPEHPSVWAALIGPRMVVGVMNTRDSRWLALNHDDQHPSIATNHWQAVCESYCAMKGVGAPC
jgi:hypothetical protein